MEAIENIRMRRSIRQFSDKPILKKDLELLVDAGRLAPTARGVQPWEFMVVTHKSFLRKIAELSENGRFIAEAAACIAVFCSDTKYYLEDGCAATENILLAATARHIGSCWVAGDKKPYCGQINSLLGAPTSYKLVSLIALGYSVSSQELKIAEKRSLKEVLHWEKF